MYVISGRTQFSVEYLKNTSLEKVVEDHKQITSAENCKSAWEQVNGKYSPKKKAPKKVKKPTEE